MLKKIIVAVIAAMPIGFLAIETVNAETPGKQVFSQELDTGLIKTRIAADQSLAFSVVQQALSDFPRDVAPVVIAAMQAGASTTDIARQCDTDIPANSIPDLVYAAISQNADAELMIDRCLCAVPIDQAPTVFMAAMQNTDVTQAESLLATAMQAFERCGGINCATASAATLVNQPTEQAESPMTASDQRFNQDRLLALVKTQASKEQSLAFLLDIAIKMNPSDGTGVSTDAFDQYLTTLLIASMQDEDERQIDRLLGVANQTFQCNDVDGSTIMIDTLVEGQFLNYVASDVTCTDECTRPLAEGVVLQLIEPTNPDLLVEPDPEFAAEADLSAQ
jgi:hypothetical protein|tara:strand:- start:763 stop:1767 length:1005 start_codon:yes stop_codon:yes gene_type:complete